MRLLGENGSDGEQKTGTWELCGKTEPDDDRDFGTLKLNERRGGIYVSCEKHCSPDYVQTLNE